MLPEIYDNDKTLYEYFNNNMAQFVIFLLQVGDSLEIDFTKTELSSLSLLQKNIIREDFKAYVKSLNLDSGIYDKKYKYKYWTIFQYLFITE